MTARSIICLACAAAGLSWASAQEADRSVYVDIGVGVAIPTDDGFDQTGTVVGFDGELIKINDRGEYGIETGAGLRLLLGIEATPRVSFELETKGLGHNVEELDGGIVVATLMANAVYRFQPMGRFEPYAGLGLGVAGLDFVDSDGDRLNDEFDDAFAYQIKAGALYPVGRHHGFSAELAYVGTGEFDEEFQDEFTDVLNEVGYGTVTGMVSYQFRFGGR